MRSHHTVAMVAHAMPSKFESWINGYGVANVSRATCCTRFAVYKWIRGESIPRTDRMLVLSRLSGGQLTFDDIVGHFAQQRTRAESAMRARFERRSGASMSSTSRLSEAHVALCGRAKDG